MTASGRREAGDTVVRDITLAAPTAAACCLTVGLAWREQGSIAAGDWLPYALLAALLVAVVLVAGAAVVPGRAPLAGVAGLAALAAWTALSASWSPLPSAARDEALLVALYALALALPLVTLRTHGGRAAAVGAVITVCAGLALATALALAFGSDPEERYYYGRLASPVGYVNAQAAAFLVAFWPAVSLAARRTLPIALRALATGAATCLLAAGLTTQSKGGAVALAASALLVLGVSRDRLRLAVPALVALALAAVSYAPLTEPFGVRGEGDALVDAAREAGGRTLMLTLAGLALGAGYAALDRRVQLGPRARRATGGAAAALLAIACLASVTAFFVQVERPRSFLGDKWGDFKTMPEREEGSSHLVNLGSNRYDFWRVALEDFRDHPLAGIGARGWSVSYLEHGRSDETPRRSHSVELDAAGETGLVGLGLLAAALLPPLLLVGRRARSDLLAAGALGSAAYFAVHASGDWVWTIPAVGLPLFLLLGAGCAAADAPPLARRLALPGAALAAAVALLAFAPPWLSARITAEVLEQSSGNAHADLRWARRFDPLSTDPLVAEAELAPRPAAAVAPLERAARREPRSAFVRLLLGRAYLAAGRRPEALQELAAAHRLSPRDEHIANTLRAAKNSKRPG
ncbi:MAG: O-antigen ligase family protein [Gaiellaceae bacterium]